MIFIKIRTEKLVQIDDKTRIDITGSYEQGNLVSYDLFEIDPDNSGTFYDVTEDMSLDWSYSVAGDTTITVRVTDSGLNTINKTAIISIITAEDDNLFSNDDDILPYETDLDKWLPDGRNSYLDKHRLAQIMILDDLDSAQIWKQDGSRYVAEDIVDIQDFKEWSKFLTLSLIFNGVSDAIDDLFETKSAKYKGRAVQAKKRACLRLDTNGDGTVETGEGVNLITGYLRRR